MDTKTYQDTLIAAQQHRMALLVIVKAQMYR